MFRPRIIPVLLLHNQILVKSVEFKKYNYIGDPINAVRIFNELKADELVFLDIQASKQGRCIDLEFVKRVGEEANMPFAVGGGIQTLEQIQNLIAAGAEKVVLSKIAAINPAFIKQASDTFGSSTVTVCIDVKNNILGKQGVYIQNGKKRIALSPIDSAKQAEQNGAGEIIIQSVNNDGKMNGYDYDLIRTISKAVTIPVVALGGAGSIAHLKQAFDQSYASALAAGSMFVYQGTNKGVLINYPEKSELEEFYRQ